MSKPRESLDHDTWLQQGIGGPADDERHECGVCDYGLPGACTCEPDDNVPDEADTDPDYD